MGYSRLDASAKVLSANMQLQQVHKTIIKFNVFGFEKNPYYLLLHFFDQLSTPRFSSWLLPTPS
jgi:hypothetical protein